MRWRSVSTAFLVAAALAAAALAWTIRANAGADQARGARLQVVAAENFYGDIASQIGGDRVQVASIMSDPNVDPHEYEADPTDAVAVARADLVIQNGADYDNWMARLLAASPASARIALSAADIAPDARKDNPHLWYSLKNIPAIADAIAKSCEKLDPADKRQFERNLKIFDDSLAPVQKEMDSIRHEFADTPVGLTETIYLYQTAPMKLNVLTPSSFQHAIAEGNDPPVASIATANKQVTAHQMKVLIYDLQAITPVTTHLRDQARDAGIPVVGVSETMPVGEHYQSWMLKQLQTLHSALRSVAK